MSGIFLTRRDSIPEADRCGLCNGNGEYQTDKYDPADKTQWTVRKTCHECDGTGRAAQQQGNEPEQADERCPECGGRQRFFDGDCETCGGTGKKPTQEDDPRSELCRAYDEMKARALAAERERDKLREAIERHRDGEITFRELWAVLEGESE